MLSTTKSQLSSCPLPTISELALSSRPTHVPKLDSDLPCDLQSDNNDQVAFQLSAHDEVQEEQNGEKEKNVTWSSPNTSDSEIESEIEINVPATWSNST